MHQVFLRTPEKEAGKGSDILVYAASWWNSQQAKKYLSQVEQPIWTSLLVSTSPSTHLEVKHATQAELRQHPRFTQE